MLTRHFIVFAVAALAWLTAPAVAQVWPWPEGGYYEDPQNQSQWGVAPEWQRPGTSPLAPRSLLPPNQQFIDPYGVEEFQGYEGFRSVFPQYPNYPRYPAGFAVPGLPNGYLPSDPRSITPIQLGLVPVLGDDVKESWPSWIDPSLPPDALPPAAERCVVSRSADRVWVLTPDEGAFIPLTFYDKFELLESGSVVEVRNKGEFQISFHDSALLVSRGPGRIALPRLSEQVAEIQLTSFRRVWLYAKSRPFRVRLPEGSLIEITGSDVYFESIEGRGMVHNHGPEVVRWTGRFGGIELPAGRRMDVMIAPPSNEFIPADLEIVGTVRPERDGRKIKFTGEGDGGTVTWSGARFRVRGGTSLTIDPLAGRQFPEKVQ